jgi:hypothetical protein
MIKYIMDRYSLNVYIIDDNKNYPTLQKDIYIGGIGHITALNRGSSLGGPKRSLIP